MNLALIWAQSTSGVIGRAGGIPWRLPEDQARFKDLTGSHTVVLGRLTWESLPAKVRPLPGRRNVVVTRDEGYTADGAEVVSSLQDVPLDDAWVIGGARIYSLALPLATRCEVTEVEIGRRRTGARPRRVLGGHCGGLADQLLGAALPDLQLSAGMKLTAAQVRRIAVAAQGFHEPRPAGPVTRAHLRRLVSRSRRGCTTRA